MLGLWLGMWEGRLRREPHNGTCHWLRFYDTDEQLVLLQEEIAELAQQDLVMAQQEAEVAKREARAAERKAPRWSDCDRWGKLWMTCKEEMGDSWSRKSLRSTVDW